MVHCWIQPWNWYEKNIHIDVSHKDKEISEMMQKQINYELSCLWWIILVKMKIDQNATFITNTYLQCQRLREIVDTLLR